MSVGVSLVLIALGAILAFAVHVNNTFINLNVIGWILMVIGLIGLLLSFLWITMWRESYRRRHSSYRDVDDGPPLV